MSLAALYGVPDAAAQLLGCFAQAGSGAELSEKDGPSGEVYVRGAWNGGRYVKFACMPERVHFTTLEARGAGIYPVLKATLPPLFKSWGVLTFTACARDLTSKQLLLAEATNGVFVERAPGSLELVLVL